MTNDVQQKRQQCLSYLVSKFPQWPRPYHSSHSAWCHCGYSWLLTPESFWILKHYDTGDVITEGDYLDAGEKANAVLEDSQQVDFKLPDGTVIRVSVGANGSLMLSSASSGKKLRADPAISCEISVVAV